MQHKCQNISVVCPTILVLGLLRMHVPDAGHVFLLLEIADVSPADINFIHETQTNTLLFPPSTRRTSELLLAKEATVQLGVNKSQAALRWVRELI